MEKKARELGQVYEASGQRVAEAEVHRPDQTGYRIAGKRHGPRATSSLAFPFYRAGEKRGDIPEGLGGGRSRLLQRSYLARTASSHRVRNGALAELMRAVLLDVTRRVRRAPRRSRPRRSRPSSSAMGQRFASVSPTIANCVNWKREQRPGPICSTG